MSKRTYVDMGKNFKRVDLFGEYLRIPNGVLSDYSEMEARILGAMSKPGKGKWVSGLKLQGTATGRLTPPSKRGIIHNVGAADYYYLEEPPKQIEIGDWLVRVQMPELGVSHIWHLHDGHLKDIPVPGMAKVRKDGTAGIWRICVGAKRCETCHIKAPEGLEMMAILAASNL